MSDIGWTHIALYSHDIDQSIDFYARYARMALIHSRETSDGTRVVWLSDRTRPFVLVLIESKDPVENPLGPFAHIGIGLPSREAVDERCAQARSEKRLRIGPIDSGPPVGYWGLIADPDGHMLEVSHGQNLFLAQTAP